MNIFIKKVSIFFVIISSFSIVQHAQSSLKSQAKENIFPQRISISTVSAARLAMIKIISHIPQDPQRMQQYEKDSVITILQCAKIVCDTARTQILQALSEIDNRIVYWNYQKNHPWKYFITKSPVKWIKGPKQEEEIEDNLETLESHQGELYVLLGQLSELDNSFTQGYKDTFLTDYTKGYEWVDAVVNALARIKMDVAKKPGENPFVVRAKLLQVQLYNVDTFKQTILSEISETVIPGHFARNWARYGGLLMGLRYGYQNITYDQIMASLNYLQTSAGLIMEPVTQTLRDILTPGWQQNMIVGASGSSYDVQLKVVKEYVSNMGQKYNLESIAKDVNKALDANDYSKYKEFVEKIGIKESLSLSGYAPFRSIEEAGKWAENLKDYGRGHLLGLEFDFVRMQKQYAALGKLGLLIPAIATGTGLYLGYQKLTKKDYSPLREALVDINSLFVVQTKQLTDEQYGEMIYLIYALKNRALRELSDNTIRADFIRDLERIESKEFNVAAKRAIVEDMFKKYSFLGLIQSK